MYCPKVVQTKGRNFVIRKCARASIMCNVLMCAMYVHSDHIIRLHVQCASIMCNVPMCAKYVHSAHIILLHVQCARDNICVHVHKCVCSVKSKCAYMYMWCTNFLLLGKKLGPS